MHVTDTRSCLWHVLVELLVVVADAAAVDEHLHLSQSRRVERTQRVDETREELRRRGPCVAGAADVGQDVAHLLRVAAVGRRARLVFVQHAGAAARA